MGQSVQDLLVRINQIFTSNIEAPNASANEKEEEQSSNHFCGLNPSKGFLKAFISKYMDYVSKALITIEIQLSFIEVIGFLVTSIFKYAYNRYIDSLFKYSK